jgi:antitoxin component YwqK of YwqJK toxin-antitoxin module
MKQLIILINLSIMVMSCGGQKDVEPRESEKGSSEQLGTQPFIEVYDNGQPKVKGMLEDGKREGLWVSFYENGVRWSEENYLDGKREGRAINFYPNGIMRYRGQFIDDKKAGLWQFYDEEGKLVRKEDF